MFGLCIPKVGVIVQNYDKFTNTASKIGPLCPWLISRNEKAIFLYCILPPISDMYVQYELRLLAVCRTSNMGIVHLCSETIVATNRMIVNRKSFRTLAPTAWVDSEVVPFICVLSLY